MVSVLWCMVLLSVCCLCDTMIYPLEMPDNLQFHFNGARMKHNLTEVPGEQILWECMQQVMWQMAEQMGHNVTRETRDYLDRLLQLAVDSSSSQIPRHRKEYRMLTDEERDRFHRAVLALKKDTTLKPNVYTAMAQLHAGDVIPMAHFGAGFPGWHRVLLLIFETALRLKDPTVSMPYWASNLDNEMDDPTQSVVWSAMFLGNGDGFVTIGPFADFKVYSTESVLTRNIGGAGSLMTNLGIQRVWAQNHTSDITNPLAPLSHNLELQHNTVHSWVGGNMDDLSTSAEDPVFFLHHSFVDYLWEEFRTRQKKIGINPEFDYPMVHWGPKEHAPEAPLGFGDLRNIDALSHVFADLVKYDQMPVCSRSHPTCESKFLKCVTSQEPPVCVSLSRDDVSKGVDPDNEVCVEARLTRAVQNSFAINQYCDSRKWSYIAVKIVLQRPPEFTNYKAFPVYNNKPSKKADIFSTVDNTKPRANNAAAYHNCKPTSSVARKIYLESYGLNYYGKFKDFTVLDQRHALSSSLSYTAVKTPDSNYTDVVLYAYDSCGRICRPFCKDFSSFPHKYTPCSGVIRITSESPKLYGDSYTDAVNNVWSAADPDDVPVFEERHESLTFYCDFSGRWPWDRDIQTRRFAQQKNSGAESVVRSQVHKTNHVNDTIRPDKHLSSLYKVINIPLRNTTFGMKSRNINLSKLLQMSRMRLNAVPGVTGNRTSNVSKRIIVKQRIAHNPPHTNSTLSKSTGSSNNIPLHEHALAGNSLSVSKNRRTLRKAGSSPTVTVLKSSNSGSDVNNIPNVRVIDLRGATKRVPIRSPGKTANIRNMFNPRAVFRSIPDGTNGSPSRPVRPEVTQLNVRQSSQRRLEGCRLLQGCVLTEPCSPCHQQSRLSCQPPSRLSAVCINGVYTIETLQLRG